MRLNRMKPLTTFSLLILLLFLALPSAYSLDWKSLGTGLAYSKITFYPTLEQGVPQNLNQATLHVFKVNPKKYQLKPLVAKKGQTLSIDQLAKRAGALVAINANFFDPQGSPLGLIIKNKEVLNRFKSISWWGVFYLSGSTARIVHSSQYRHSRRIDTAIQAGPRLVVNGAPPKLKEETSPKSAIGINHNGDVFLLATRDTIPINQLAQIMAKSEANGGLGIVHGLNLDGGSSTQMYARIGSFSLNLPSYVGVPVGLGVFRK
jgi:uncharacterized protein YigE (DUF2233 family)